MGAGKKFLYQTGNRLVARAEEIQEAYNSLAISNKNFNIDSGIELIIFQIIFIQPYINSSIQNNI